MRKLLVLVYIVIITAAVYNHQAIADWWFLQSYEPDSRIAALAGRAELSDEGRRYFYVSDPEINDKQEFNRNCPELEEALVLGCYSGREIYLLEIERPELDGVMEVTAAHEMLHAVYDRLSTREREDIDRKLMEAYRGIEEPKLRKLIESYEDNGGQEVLLNELHSILPTQVLELPPDLEDYYGDYFNDRRSVAGLYLEYESVLSGINDRIDNLKGRIEQLRTDIDAQENYIGRLRSEIEDINRRMRELRQSGDNEAHNRLVPQQNALVQEHNAAVSYNRDLVERHNAVVNDVNDLVILQNDLVNSMDSRYEAL